MPPPKILVPLDGSTEANEMLLLAGEAAANAGGSVIGLYVNVLPPSLPLSDLPEEVDRAGRAILFGAEQAAASHGFAITTRLVRGRSVARVIVLEAADLGVDSIFMASDKRRPWWLSWLKPRIAEQVVRTAACSVVVGEAGASPYEMVVPAKRSW